MQDLIQTLFALIRDISDYLIHVWHQLEKYAAPVLVISSCLFRNVPTVTLLLALVVVIYNWLGSSH